MLTDLIATVGALGRFGEAARIAAPLAAAWQRARGGDEDAIAFLVREGWRDALDAAGLVVGAPHLGEVAGAAVHHLKSAGPVIGRAMRGDVVDGEWREVVDAPPWTPFARYLEQVRWGVFLLAGPKGSGKTMRALRLAEMFRERLGWPVYAVNLYPDDRPEWVTGTTLERWVARCDALRDAIAAVEDEDEIEGDERVDREAAKDLIRRMGRRIVIFDEMSATVRGGAFDKGRNLVNDVFAHARHLEWIVIYCAQSLSMVPKLLINAEATILGRPHIDPQTGEPVEAETDRDLPIVKRLWRGTADAFAGLSAQPGYETRRDPRAWAYVSAPDVGRGKPFEGLVPFRMPGELATSAEEAAS